MKGPLLPITVIFAYHFAVHSISAAEGPSALRERWVKAAHTAELLQNAGDPAAETAWKKAIDGVVAELPQGSGSVALRLSRFAYSLHDAGLDTEAYPLASR